MLKELAAVKKNISLSENLFMFIPDMAAIRSKSEQVLRPIIITFPIYMMAMLPGFQISTDQLFCNCAMLIYIAPFILVRMILHHNHDVTIDTIPTSSISPMRSALKSFSDRDPQFFPGLFRSWAVLFSEKGEPDILLVFLRKMATSQRYASFLNCLGGLFSRLFAFIPSDPFVFFRLTHLKSL